MVIIPGQRRDPYRFTCEACGAAVESFRTGRQLPRFCNRSCRDASRRLGNVNRYPQAGYWMLRWNDGGRKVHIWEHRKVWEDANGPIPTGLIVHHRNGDGFDNRLDNLELLTRADHARVHKSEDPEVVRLRRNAKARSIRSLQRRIRELESELAACTCRRAGV
jgi:hypothetical protein